MDKKSATSLIRDTFQQPFDKERFVHFVKNLVNDVDETKALVCQGQYIHEKFRDFVKKYERIGTYTDPSDQKVDILIVYLKNEGTLARARTSQRNFISTYLKSRDAKDAGLIAFVSPNPEDWRFSFVKMEYKLAEKKGKLRAEEEFTPARRYSFLVGRHESSHTAQQQLLPILSDDQHNPTLEIIENAFKIETVTKEFFEKYRGLFWEVKDALDALVKSDSGLRKEFETKRVGTADFAKKLLGQIVFLHFLQKKGWFGVDRDAAWGSGHKNFLRQLFEGKLMKYGNFFNDVLEPLFYEALAVEREDNFYSKFNCKIPFLNGGLFDPISSYDWIHTDISLPNELFSNEVKTAEEDLGTGILDIFDRYNFTVKEDEPLEKEVAVDPEMLGKVFENLLEVNDRKSKGTYYTPREIVHYMCQESLINYLVTEIEGTASKEDIQLFIRMGETVIEHDARVIQRGEENSAYSFKLPESIRKNAEVIDLKLATIRVCDPAIGSGAFPVGMMNEIVRARQTLSSYLPKSSDRLPYDLKRHAIQESLYGVDIDSGAVEIAKLRLWLSLIVDEDDIERIKPLPNLDYRIMQGNSLLEEFEGIRLFDDKLLESNVEDRGKQLAEAKKKMDELQSSYIDQHASGKLTDARGKEIHTEIKRLQNLRKQLLEKPVVSENMGMFDTPSRAGEVLKELKSLHSAFFSATQRKKKDEIKKKIEALDWELIEISLTEKKKGDLLEKLKRTRVRPFFLWKLHFSDVFREKGGFDVVIANPPYVSAWSMEKENPTIRETLVDRFRQYNVLKGHWDLYIAFVLLGYELLNPAGSLSYILPNPCLREKYAEGFRNFLLNKMSVLAILLFDESKVFKEVSRKTVVFVISKKQDNRNVEFYNNSSWGHAESRIDYQRTIDVQRWKDNYLCKFQVEVDEEKEALLKKIESLSIRIGNLCYVNYGAQVSSKQKGIFKKSDVVSNQAIGNAKKFYEGKDLKNWVVRWRGLYLDYRKNELYGSRTEEIFENKKIAVRKVSDKNHKIAFALDNSKMYCDDGLILILPHSTLEQVSNISNFSDYEKVSCNFSLEYICGFLSSKLINFYFKSRFATESLQQTTSHTYPQAVRALPIICPNLDQLENMEIKVRSVIEKKGKGENSEFIESQIDKLVYQIYGLTDDEIKMLEECIA